jgi:hypothetical protein
MAAGVYQATQQVAAWGDLHALQGIQRGRQNVGVPAAAAQRSGNSTSRRRIVKE